MKKILLYFFTFVFICFLLPAMLTNVKNKNKEIETTSEETSEEKEQEQGMQVFMYPEATQDQIDKLRDDLNNIEGINTIEFVSKEEGYNTIKKRFGKNAKAIEGYDLDFFEVSYRITLTDLSLNRLLSTL